MTHARNCKDQLFFFPFAPAMLEENDVSSPFHLVAGERSRDGWDVLARVIRQATSVTIQSEAGHMIMLEDQQRFLSIIRRLIPVQNNA